MPLPNLAAQWQTHFLCHNNQKQNIRHYLIYGDRVQDKRALCLNLSSVPVTGDFFTSVWILFYWTHLCSLLCSWCKAERGQRLKTPVLLPTLKAGAIKQVHMVWCFLLFLSPVLHLSICFGPFSSHISSFFLLLPESVFCVIKRDKQGLNLADHFRH